jgi:hypothetical protein
MNQATRRAPAFGIVTDFASEAKLFDYDRSLSVVRRRIVVDGAVDGAQ